MSLGYTGKILNINLSNCEITIEEPADSFYRQYYGGWNTILYYLLTRTPPGIDPFDERNLLVFASGILTGLPLQGTARNAIGSKSPLTGGLAASEAGGYWGSELKMAGFDAVVVSGKAESPVYLWIHQGKAEIREADHLWGLNTADCLEKIRDELGDARIRATLIGPGGENLVRYASITNDLTSFAGRGGLGAVMGSKNLKAIAVRGKGRIPVADKEQLTELAKWLNDHMDLLGTLPEMGTGTNQETHLYVGNLPVHNFRDGDFPTVSKISAQAISKTLLIDMHGCYACSVRCKKTLQASEPYEIDPRFGGVEYESLVAMGSNCGIDDLEAVCKANELCNAYTLDGISTGVSIAFAMECFEKGLLSLEDTDGLELRFGNADVLVPLVEKIARREGIGNFLADGVKRMAEAIGHDSAQYAMHVKGQEYPMHEPRLKRGLALGYSVSPTGADHMHALHDTGFVHEGALDKVSPLGILKLVPVEDFGPDKVRLALYQTISSVSSNCALVCAFVPWNYEHLVDMIRAATGWNHSLLEYFKVGERAFTMARVYNVREGFQPQDDWLPQRSFEPPRNGNLKTAVDPDELAEAVRMLYGMAGWDDQTGVPKPAKLHELGIGWVQEFTESK